MFDNRKDIYKGELTLVMDIPDEDEEEEAEEEDTEARSGESKVGGGMSAPDVLFLIRTWLYFSFYLYMLLVV